MTIRIYYTTSGCGCVAGFFMAKVAKKRRASEKTY